MDRRQRVILRIALIAGAALALLVGGAPAASAAKKKKAKHAATPAAFCSAPIVDNYREPLERLQPITAVPTGGVLRFAPAGTTLAAIGPSGLLVGGSTVGFRLANAAPEGTKARTLDWTVLERLIRLTDNGHRAHPAGLKRINLRQLPAGKHRGLTFPLSPTPAIYSLEITIQNHRGRLLGRYGEYVRVVSPLVNVGLTLATYDGVAPGSILGACVENHGTAAVEFGYQQVERFDGTTWHPVPRPILYGPAPPIPTYPPLVLGPGAAEGRQVTIEREALPGLYKVTMPGKVQATGEPLAVSAEFGVL
jgi:hypothetical protein